MHMVIYALVEAPAQHDALAEGKAVFDRLVGANPTAAPCLTTTAPSMKRI